MRCAGWDRWQELHCEEPTHGKASVREKAHQSPVKGSLTFSENKLPESLGRVEPQISSVSTMDSSSNPNPANGSLADTGS